MTLDIKQDKENMKKELLLMTLGIYEHEEKMQSPNKWLTPRKTTEEDIKENKNCSTCHFVSACETKSTGLFVKICDNYNQLRTHKK